MIRPLRIAAIAALAFACAPAVAQPAEPPSSRAELFAQLPHWPGYWVSEDQAGTTITGLATAVTDAAGGSTLNFANMMVLRGEGAAWNEEGRRRYAADLHHAHRLADCEIDQARNDGKHDDEHALVSE